MNMLTNVFGVHDDALRLKSQRLELLARNIANADTPNFKARDLDFKAVLHKTGEGSMLTTHSEHIPLLDGPESSGVKFRTPFNASFDGNTVEMGVEQAQYGKAAADYQATLSFLENRVSGLRKALRGD